MFNIVITLRRTRSPYNGRHQQIPGGVAIFLLRPKIGKQGDYVGSAESTESNIQKVHIRHSLNYAHENGLIAVLVLQA